MSLAKLCGNFRAFSPKLHSIRMMSANPHNYHVGELSSTQPEATQYEKTPFKRARHPEPYRFEVNMSAEAGLKQKKSAVVSVNIPGFSAVKLNCDEQPPVGDDTAPPPLAYFSAGIGLCLMTHLTDILTARKIKVDSLKLEQRMIFRTNLGHMREHGYMTEGGCDLVETHVLIDSPETQEDIKKLLDEAEGACMAHFCLRNPVPWKTRLVYNGEEALSRSG